MLRKMSSLAESLGPEITNLGELIGILSSGDFNARWFSDVLNELEQVPERLPELLTLIDHVFGPAEADGPQVFPGAQWYSIRKPSDGTPTRFFLVASKKTEGITSGTVGIGVFNPYGVQDLVFQAYGFAPLFALSTTEQPVFLPGKAPLNAGVIATSKDPFQAPGTVTFRALKLDVNIYLEAKAPAGELVFDALTINGVPAPDKSTYSTLGALVSNISDVGEWVASVLLQGTYWLNTYLGSSDYTVGSLLSAACVLETADAKKGTYQLNLEYLKTNAGNSRIMVENFLFNLMDLLSNSSKPLIPIPAGAAGSGIHIVKQPASGGGNDYGLRLVIQDIKVGGGQQQLALAAPEGTGVQKSKTEYSIQIGKWLGQEKDSNSWVARSLNQTKDFTPPGVSVYLLTSTTMAADCSSSGPSLTFAPHVELVSLGLDVGRADKQPLFNVNGYVMSSTELRVYLKQLGGQFTFGSAGSMDGLGVPLGPGFGDAVKGPDTNKVAQSLLESGEGKGGEAESGGDQDPINPSFGVSMAFVQRGSFVAQLYDKDGAPADQVVIPIQRAVGPLQCEKLGLGWVQDAGDASKDRLSLLFDGGLKLGVLNIQLFGLSIGIPVTAPGDFSKYDLDLNGLGITLTSPSVELSAAFVKLPKDPKATPPRNYAEYNGEALVKAGTFAVAALGSYAYVPEEDDSDKGYASLFIFGVLNGTIGGPAFFFVTGLAGGFGYNRRLILPEQDGIPDYPFVAGASDPSKLGATQNADGGWLAPSPATALAKISRIVPPERGQYWLAAGVRFTSFNLINSTALLVVAFGNELEIAILGLSWLSLPPPPAPGASAPAVKYAYAELGIAIKILPSQGLFSATAILSANSFVIDPACKLTGGFAFYVWFGNKPGNPPAGQFVLTLGGYHPDFKPPDYFPKVPRLGFNWPLPGNVTISGEAYFALTPSAVMAGGGLQVLYHNGNLKAWFRAEMHALIVWAPFHYRLEIAVTLGASYVVNLLFITTTLKVELGARLDIWGPKMGGRVYVSWFVISFTVSFGASDSSAPPPLDWSNPDGTGFAQTLLPHKTNAKKAPALRAAMAAAAETVEPAGIYTVVVNDGLLKTITKGAATIWVVRGNHFTFSTVTAIPATVIEITPVDGEKAKTTFTAQEGCAAGSDYFVCLRPMDATLSASVFKITLTDDTTHSTFDLAGRFDFTLACRPVEAAKFGRPLGNKPPEPNELLPNRLMGLENVTPKAPVLAPSGAGLLEIDVAAAFTYDVVDNTPPHDPYHLPLSTATQPSGPVPHVDANVIPKIEHTLMNPVVVRVRNEIFAALSLFGINPMTNGSLGVYAANPGGVLAGNPLVLDCPE
jgi:hypothetical protein